MITTRSSLLYGADDAQRMVSVFGGVLCLDLEFSSLWGRHGGMTTITVIIIMIIIVIIIIIIIQKRHHPCHGEEGGGRHRQIRARRNFREGSETSRLPQSSQKKITSLDWGHRGMLASRATFIRRLCVRDFNLLC